MRLRARAHLLALLLATPALAQTASEPQVAVTVDPDGPVTVGTPVEVTVTVLVPTYMPQPPVWPDLQIADAITRLPDRATHPVTQRIGQESWSGLSRTWEIVPQRPADFDLGSPTVRVTYADPATNAPVTASVDLPGIAFSATLPPGAEGIDPFVAATALTVTATVDGLPTDPKPGDAFTLTLTTEASGPPAMTLPPLAGQVPTPPGLRAYPRQPTLADTPGDPPTAVRTEAIAYVIEAPGAYTLPGPSLDWWNTSTETRETAATDPVSLAVPAPAGWQAGASAGSRPLPTAGWLAIAGAFLIAVYAFARSRRHPGHPPSEASLYRALRRAARREPPSVIRNRLAEWRAVLPDQTASTQPIEGPLRDLERVDYGRPGTGAPERSLRRALSAGVEEVRFSRRRRRKPVLPALNPTQIGVDQH